MEGEELKKWRWLYKLTQLELAKHLKVERVTIARWEVGIRAIPPFLFLALEALENRLMKGGDQGQFAVKPNSIRKEVKRHGKSISKKTQKREDG
jgi:DNA-binding XRE family transcriptional regulator